MNPISTDAPLDRRDVAAREDVWTIEGLNRDALFTEFAPLIKRLIYRFGRTPELRQDLPGELYCGFHTLIDRYEPDRGIPLQPYLVRQLSACAYAYARKQWTWAQRMTPFIDAAEISFRLIPTDPTADWDANLFRSETLSVLRRMLSALPARQSQVIVAHFYENRSYEEIAAQLGIEPSSVRSLARHGLNHLRERTVTLST